MCECKFCFLFDLCIYFVFKNFINWFVWFLDCLLVDWFVVFICIFEFIELIYFMGNLMKVFIFRWKLVMKFLFLWIIVEWIFNRNLIYNFSYFLFSVVDEWFRLRIVIYRYIIIFDLRVCWIIGDIFGFNYGYVC